MTQLVVPARFNGPPRSGNGGWSAGSLATLLAPDATVSVRLHRPPPLDAAMEVAVDDGTAVATIDGDVVLTAGRVEDEAVPVAVPPVDAETAAATAPRFRGVAGHPFPTCFTCGPERSPGDALRLTPGLLLFRDDATACVWDVAEDLDAGDGTVAAPVVWAALDCPGGWSVDLAGRPMVLGTITARLRRLPRVGERCVVTGAALGSSGRKAMTATTLYGADGAELARAAHVWVAIDPATFTP